MKELIKVTANEQGSQVVSARELYQFLEVKTPFRMWSDRMFEYGFENGKDYTPYIFVHPQNKQETADYALTLDTAKEIAMLQRTEKGKQARQYFIECEKALKQTAAVAVMPSVKELALMVLKAEEEKEALMLENAKLAPKAEFTDKVLQSADAYPITVIAKELGMSAIELNKKLCDRGIQYKAHGTYLLYAKYQGKGFTKAHTHAYQDSEGIPRTHTYTVWTEYGRAFIHSLFNKDLSFNKSVQRQAVQ